MALPFGAQTVKEVFDQLERGVPLRRVGSDPKPKPDYSIIFVRRNGAGKHELCVQHPTGVPVILSTEL